MLSKVKSRCSPDIRGVKFSMRNLVAFLVIGIVMVGPFLEGQERLGAILQPTNTVTVNGSRVRSETTLFDGDRVQTGADSAAAISGNGQQIVAAANTWLIYHPTGADLGCGNAQLSGQQPAHAGQYSISITKPGQYEILQHDGKLKITSKGAELSVTNGPSNWTVPAGGIFLQTVAGLCLVSATSGAIPGTVAAATSMLTTAATTGSPASTIAP